MSQYYLTQQDYLIHHGVKGQKWGLRQWQNPDGSLTAAGREHYGYGAKAEYKNRIGLAKANYKNTKNAINSRVQKGEEKIEENYAPGQRLSRKDLARQEKLYADAKRDKQAAKDAYKAEKRAAKEAYKNSDEYKARIDKAKQIVNDVKTTLSDPKVQKAIKIGVAVAGTALAAYGAYKVGKLKVERAETIINGRKMVASYTKKNYSELLKQQLGYYTDEVKNRSKDDIYKNWLEKDIARDRNYIIEANKYISDASKASNSNTLSKLKAARKYAKDSGLDYKRFLDNAEYWKKK